MATSLEFKLTNAGIAAAFNAESTGIDVVLTHVAFGSGFKAPDGTETALLNERKRLTIISGSRVLPDQIRIAALWSSDSDEQAITEIGVYAGTVLFAYSSRGTGTVIGTKNAGVDFAFYYNWALKDIPANTITVQVDANGPAAMAALAAHEADVLAHKQYLRRSAVAQEGSVFRWGGVGGTPDAIALTLPAESYLTSYVAGQEFKFQAKFGNSGPISLSINGLGVRSVRKDGATALAAGDIVAGRVYSVTFDGANFQLAGGTGTTTGGTSDGNVFYHYPFIATAGQKTFEVPYEVDALLVFVKGDIVPPERFTATDGVNVVLDVACAAGDEVEIIIFRATAAANVYTKPQTYSRAEVVNLLLGKQDVLNFTPVQQGGGVGQNTDKIRLGGDGAGNILAQIGSTELGKLWTANNFNPALKANIGALVSVAESKTLTAAEVGLVLIDATSGALTIKLPDATELGMADIIVRRVDNGANRLVIQASGSDRIRFHTHLSVNGYSFFVLMGAGDWWRLRSDGAGNWWPVGRCDTTPLGRPSFETTTAFSPGGYGAISGTLLNRADWPWLWDHAQKSGMLVVDGTRSGKEGSWTSGNGTTTFRTPEVRGEFLRMLDESRGIDTSRIAGYWQADIFRSHNHTTTFVRERITAAMVPDGGNAVLGDQISDGLQVMASNSVGGTETRPRNIAYPGRIKLI